MEAHPGFFVSDVDAQEWEPVPEYPGSESHVLVESDGYQAGFWRIRGEGSMTLRWNPPARDTFLVLEGAVRIEIPDGPTLDLKPGMVVSLPRGVETTWHVTTPYKDVYVIG